MKIMIKKIRRNILLGIAFFVYATAAKAQVTTVDITIPQQPESIDPMIYGQMLENVNDSVIYRGVADVQGNERKYITSLLKELQIPVMRWPGGTVVHEYRWRNGIGPKPLRPVVSTYAWKGTENYQFGTDEFLQWCRRIGSAPYINFNMGNSIEYGGTLWEALEWIAYVNGDTATAPGKLRAYNGHSKPYNVKYWCIGNENYGPWGRHTAEDDTSYAKRLLVWASTIKKQYPDISLLGVGHNWKWNKAVLAQNGQYIDFLTQHYYVTSKVKDGLIQQPYSTLFAPAKMEAHLQKLGAQLDTVNKELGRTANPIRLSIDEWNNRHSVYNGKEYKFSRQSPRRQFDVPVIAGMLNVFIRQCNTVGMANYIFPVNGHGLIRSVGEDDAFLTPVYYVFQQYRTRMTGVRIDAAVQGPGMSGEEVKPTIDGDPKEVTLEGKFLTFIDAVAVLTREKNIHVSLINRSADKEQTVEIRLPAGYNAESVWELNHHDINACNTADNRSEIVPATRVVKSHNQKLTVKIPPCGLAILRLVAK
jgi:alpha-N-arabinofuranosidase